MQQFEPKIISFLCNWCSYAGADLAGISRIQYPTNIRVIRVMCSGRVDPIFIIEAFVSGFDGVLVLGCHPGDCHYLTGNYQAEKKMKMTKKILKISEINSDRLCLDWVSAGEGDRFAKIVTDFTNKIKEIGPLYNGDKSIKQQLLITKKVLEEEKIRWLVGRQKELIEVGNVFNDVIPEDEFDELIERNLMDEYNKNKIAQLLKDNPLFVNEISKHANLRLEDVSSYLVDLEGEGKITIHSIEGRNPKYINPLRDS